MTRHCHRVAVYGTLKHSEPNHHILASSDFLGTCSLSSIVLYDLGPYPGAKLGRSGGVLVEVYAVDPRTFTRLDQLEGYNARAPKSGLYDRVLLDTPYGDAWVYVYNHDVSGCLATRSGGWSTRARC
ncbi:gamma-glutamylcyclotransferase family protein [Marinobacter zhanjiangensis]|uniref:Gamma-glutamylcyclotransferase family protein n=1 Tax=Marinobacter zhanjiangensis TaxID=578215 RepID=A0ABQ3AT80_9GAMM|nr:gamma-glutamylcyclotransferase family protein [Marinobacter zhanjiangensis]GGY63367.1 gamma-glutamylcyclotransferase family protein YtfP [Marinobacter zhanjiangensis]